VSSSTSSSCRTFFQFTFLSLPCIRVVTEMRNIYELGGRVAQHMSIKAKLLQIIDGENRGGRSEPVYSN
jgi:hypothetical protein